MCGCGVRGIPEAHLRKLSFQPDSYQTLTSRSKNEGIWKVVQLSRRIYWSRAGRHERWPADLGIPSTDSAELEMMFGAVQIVKEMNNKRSKEKLCAKRLLDGGFGRSHVIPRRRFPSGRSCQVLSQPNGPVGGVACSEPDAFDYGEYRSRMRDRRNRLSPFRSTSQYRWLEASCQSVALMTRVLISCESTAFRIRDSGFRYKSVVHVRHTVSENMFILAASRPVPITSRLVVGQDDSHDLVWCLSAGHQPKKSYSSWDCAIVSYQPQTLMESSVIPVTTVIRNAPSPCNYGVSVHPSFSQCILENVRRGSSRFTPKLRLPLDRSHPSLARPNLCIVSRPSSAG